MNYMALYVTDSIYTYMAIKPVAGKNGTYAMWGSRKP